MEAYDCFEVCPWKSPAAEALEGSPAGQNTSVRPLRRCLPLAGSALGGTNDFDRLHQKMSRSLSSKVGRLGAGFACLSLELAVQCGTNQAVSGSNYWPDRADSRRRDSSTSSA